MSHTTEKLIPKLGAGKLYQIDNGGEYYQLSTYNKDIIKKTVGFLTINGCTLLGGTNNVAKCCVTGNDLYYQGWKSPDEPIVLIDNLKKFLQQNATHMQRKKQQRR